MLTFGNRLKQLRTEKELTQSQLSTILETAKSNISKYESDNIEPNLATLNRLSRYFNVSTDFLLGIESKSTPSKNNDSDPQLSSQEKRLIDIYRSLNDDSRIIALSKLLELSREEALVAAKEERYLDSRGKSLPSSGTGGDVRIG